MLHPETMAIWIFHAPVTARPVWKTLLSKLKDHRAFDVPSVLI
jgi:hypothetical protein